MERCVKCGKIGQDRRTLWMKCFYAMDELKVPFKQVVIKGILQEVKKIEKTQFGNFPTFKDVVDAKEDQYKFFTLRVCKECRASWLDTIEKWFKS